MHILDRLNYDINCLISIESENKNSFMFHTPSIELVKLQSECLDKGLIYEKNNRRLW